MHTPSSSAASPTLNPDETEALIAALHQKDPERGYATSLVRGRVCLIVRPASGKRFVLPLPAPYRGTYCTSVEDLLKLELEGPPLSGLDQPHCAPAVEPHCAQLQQLSKVADAAQHFASKLAADGFDAPHLVQATIHGVTLYWPRLDGGRLEVTFATWSMTTYPSGSGQQRVVRLMCKLTMPGRSATVQGFDFEAVDALSLADELKIPRTPVLPRAP